MKHSTKLYLKFEIPSFGRTKANDAQELEHISPKVQQTFVIDLLGLEQQQRITPLRARKGEVQ
jgi:hypothetical protein